MDRCESYKWGERFECRYDKGRPFGIMVGYNYCSSTKECDACSCGGDKTKCDFYPDIKRKAIYELKGIKTNADRIRRMTDEELAEFLIHTEVSEEVWYFTPDGDRFDWRESAIEHTLNWLKSEAK